MAFLHPGILWGLLALIIPVIIHLFNFQKTERVVFANTRLLQEVTQKTRKARQLKNWILLLFRLLALAFLIIAFAQPFLQSDNQIDTKAGLPQVGVYLDNSVSMMISKDEKAPFDLALSSAKAIPNGFQKKGWFELLTNEFDSRHIWTSAKGFEDQLLDVGSSSVGRNLETVVNRFSRQLAGQNLGDQKVQVIISDFQKSTIGKTEPLFPDSNVRYKLNLIEQSELSNVFIDSVWLAKPISFGQKSQELRISISCSGLPYKKPVNLQLYSAGNLISGKTATFSDQKNLEFSLPFRIKANELLSCTLTVDDQMVAFDNQFYFTLKAPPPTQVYVLDKTQNLYLKNILKNPNLFKYESTDYGSINFQKLKEADLVILNEPETIDDALTQSLDQKLQMGASVLIIPSSKSDIKQRLLTNSGIQIAAVPAEGGLKPTNWKIKMPLKTDPFFFGVFAEISNSSILPFSSPEWTISGGQKLLSYESGQAFLSAQKVKNGTIFILAAPLRESNGNLQKHPLFIPLMYKIVFSGNQSAELPLFYRTTDYTVTLPADSTGFGNEKPITLVNGKIKTIATQRKKGNKIIVELAGDQMSVGFWQAQIENKQVGVIALNRDRSESIMEFYSADELKTAFASKPWVSVTSISKNASQAHLTSDAGVEFSIWKYCICLSLLMFACEMITIKIGNPTKRTAQ